MSDPPEMRTTRDVYSWLVPRILQADQQIAALVQQIFDLQTAPYDSTQPRESIDVVHMRLNREINSRAQKFDFANSIAKRMIQESGQRLPDGRAIATAMHAVEDSDLPLDLRYAKAAWVDLQQPEEPVVKKRRIGFITDD